MRKTALNKLLLLLTLVATIVCAMGISVSAETEGTEKILVNNSTTWTYLDNDTDPAEGLDSLTAWTLPAFDDSAWKTGTGYFGTKRGSIATIEGVTPNVLLDYYRADGTSAMPSYFFRTTVTIDNPADYISLEIAGTFDDSVAIYINGTVVLDQRKTIPTDTNLAYVGTRGRSVSVSVPMSKLSCLKAGENVVAVEVHQEASTSSDVLMAISNMSLVRASKEKNVDESVVMNIGSDESERRFAWFSTFAEAGELRLVKASAVENDVFPAEYQTYSVSVTPTTNVGGKYAKAATVTSLEPNTEYAYMIVCGEECGEIRYFKTGTNESNYNFVYVGDPQISKKEHADSWQDTLQKIAAYFSPELLVSGGDQVNSPNDELLYSYLIQKELANFTFAPTVGPGHDSSGTSFAEHFNLPNLSDKYGVGTTSSNYWYTYKNTLFMHLNMEDNDALFNGEHEAFITEVMAANPDVKWTILVAHRAPFSTGLHGNPDYKNYATEIARIRPALSALATKMDIDVVLSAHDHVYVRTHMMVNDQVSPEAVVDNKIVNPEGILYITANSSTASKFYAQSVQNAYFVAKENYEQRKSAIYFEITDTSLTMKTYFMDDMTEFDTFTIEKKDVNFTPDGDRVTPYGVIPEGDENPVAVFDKAGNYLGGYATLKEAFTAHMITKSNIIIYLRRNLELFGDRPEYDLGKGIGVKVIDLNGKTLSLNASLLYAQAKKSGSLQVTVKNGTISTNGANVLILGSNLSSMKEMNVNFENITFNNITKNHIVTDALGAEGIVKSKVSFTDCIFENPASPLFNLGNSENTFPNIIINGGEIRMNGTTPPTLFQTMDYIDNAEVVFGEGNDGKCPRLITAKNTSDATVPTVNQMIVFAKSATEESETESVYVLSEKTPYGYIGEEYLDANKYPLAVFYQGEFLFATDIFETEGVESALGYFTTNKCTKQHYVIYLRRDYNNSNGEQNWVAGRVKGNLIFDLGGHTFSLARQMLTFQTRTSGTCNFTVKNGTILTNGKKLFSYSYKSAYTPDYCLFFENIVFDSISTPLITFVASAHSYGVHVEMRGCTYNVTSQTAYVFEIPAPTDQVVVGLKILGGNFNFPEATMNLVDDLSESTEPLVTYGEYNGAYPVIHTGADAETTSAFAAQKDDGTPLGLRKTAENTYVLSPFTITSAYLNITNDLNLVYRVFLPKGYANPVATFVVNDFTFVMEEYTIDENGLYLFKLCEIGPHRMADVVSATVTATYNGEIVTVTDNTLSVKTYADMVRAQNAENESLCALLDALLVYGATAQVYMGYNTDNLVSEIGALADITTNGTIVKGGSANAEYSILSCSLRLDGAFDFGVKIQAKDIAGLTLKITKGGVATEIAITEDMKSGNRYVAYYDGMFAFELDEEITFALMHNGEQIGNSYTLSANTYLAKLQNSENNALLNLTKALYAYGVAAEAYNA